MEKKLLRILKSSYLKNGDIVLDVYNRYRKQIWFAHNPIHEMKSVFKIHLKTNSVKRLTAK